MYKINNRKNIVYCTVLIFITNSNMKHHKAKIQPIVVSLKFKDNYNTTDDDQTENKQEK